jgi:endonuclease/exonuclease/phosphatase family metal-dependent hydrolase
MASDGLLALLGAAVVAPPKAVTAASASRQARTPGRRTGLRSLLWDARRAGDLNAEPGSADERTWPSDRPDRRIDYIWLSGDLAASRFVATTSTASDHRGIAVTVRQA